MCCTLTTLWGHIRTKNLQSGTACLRCSRVFIDLCKINIHYVVVCFIQYVFVLGDLIEKLCPETKLIRSAMELFPAAMNEDTKKRRKWGPIRSDTDIGYERLPNLVPKDENKIR